MYVVDVTFIWSALIRLMKIHDFFLFYFFFFSLFSLCFCVFLSLVAHWFAIVEYVSFFLSLNFFVGLFYSFFLLPCNKTFDSLFLHNGWQRAILMCFFFLSFLFQSKKTLRGKNPFFFLCMYYVMEWINSKTPKHAVYYASHSFACCSV